MHCGQSEKESQEGGQKDRKEGQENGQKGRKEDQKGDQEDRKEDQEGGQEGRGRNVVELLIPFQTHVNRPIPPGDRPLFVHRQRDGLTRRRSPPAGDSKWTVVLGLPVEPRVFGLVFEGRAASSSKGFFNSTTASGSPLTNTTTSGRRLCWPSTTMNWLTASQS